MECCHGGGLATGKTVPFWPPQLGTVTVLQHTNSYKYIKKSEQVIVDTKKLSFPSQL